MVIKFMKTNMKSKYKISTITMIVSIVMLGVIVPAYAHAGVFSFIGDILGNVAADLLSLLVGLIQGLLGLLIKVGAAFFETMLNFGFTRNSSVDIVKTGWTVTRDFANMLFILFMIVIAFATILRIEGYGIKKLLPKVIGIALLINFSMVLCSVVVDFSNITANFFVKDINTKLNGKTMGAVFVDSMNLSKILTSQIDYSGCDKTYREELSSCDEMRKTMVPGDYQKCRTNAQNVRVACEQQLAIAAQNAAKPKNGLIELMDVLISGIFGSILLLIVVFTFFAGGVLLLIRMISIWFLIMIVPLVFICYIIPSLNSNWKKWWGKFLNWCIFAPAYSFFIWLAIKVSIEQSNKKIVAGISSANNYISDPGVTNNPFIFNPGQNLISFAFIIALLVGGLIVAKSLGVYGADTVMKIATNARKGATDWAKRKSTGAAKELGARGAGSLKQGVGSILKMKYSPFKSTGRRMEAGGKLMKQDSASAKEVEAYKKRLAVMSREDMVAEINSPHLRKSFKLAAIQEAQKRGDLSKTDNLDAIRSSVNTLKAYGYDKSSSDLQNNRADAIEDRTKQKEIVEKMAKEGKLGELSLQAIKDENVTALLAEVCEPQQLEAIRNTSRQHAEALDKALEDITNPLNAAAMTAKHINPALEKIQHAYAAQTGKLDRLTAGPTGTAQSFIKEVGANYALKRVKSVPATAMPDIVPNIPVNKLKSMIAEMEDTAAKEVITYIKHTLPNTHDLWKLVDKDESLKNIAP